MVGILKKINRTCFFFWGVGGGGLGGGGKGKKKCNWDLIS